MREAIHPEYFKEATVICACGNSWRTGSTVEIIQTDICSECHPFFTGEQRIVDTEGQVDRFYKKLQARQDYLEERDRLEAERTSPELPISELELGSRIQGLLTGAGFVAVGEVLEKLEHGDTALLAIDGFGRKSLADLKRALRHRGYILPEAVSEPQV